MNVIFTLITKHITQSLNKSVLVIFHSLWKLILSHIQFTLLF